MTTPTHRTSESPFLNAAVAPVYPHASEFSALSSHYESFNERILELLKHAYSYLFRTGDNQGHWHEVRCTALAAICLQFREDGDSPWLKAIRSWLCNSQIHSGEQAGSWGEEVWDTAMAVIALKELELSSKDETIDKALRWMAGLYSVNERNNWHDELWETSWALMAIFRCGRTLPTVSVEAAIEWLAAFQDTNGKIISPHYTAYFLLVEYFSRKTNLSDAARHLLYKTKERSIAYLLATLDNANPATLWTGEHWANGQILWALCVQEAFVHRHDSIHLLDLCVTWFETTQESSGNWSDIEDTASSIIGLYSLMRMLSFQTVDSGVPPWRILQELEFRLRKAVPSPRLGAKRRLIEYDARTGYTSINLSTRSVRWTTAILLFIFVTLLSWVANVIQIMQVLYGYGR